MKIKLKVHSNSSQEKIIQLSLNEYEIWLKEKPVENKANEKIEKIMSKYFGKKAKITSGFTNKIKYLNLH